MPNEPKIDVHDVTQEQTDEILDAFHALIARFIGAGGVPPRVYLSIIAAHAAMCIYEAPVGMRAMIISEFVGNLENNVRRICE